MVFKIAGQTIFWYTFRIFHNSFLLPKYPSLFLFLEKYLLIHPSSDQTSPQRSLSQSPKWMKSSLLYTFIAPLTKLFYSLFISCGDCLWVYFSHSLSDSSLYPSFSYPPSTSQLIAWYLEHSKATNMYWALRLLLNICWINEGNT